MPGIQNFLCWGDERTRTLVFLAMPRDILLLCIGRTKKLDRTWNRRKRTNPFSLSSAKIEKRGTLSEGWKILTRIFDFLFRCSEPMGIKAPAFLGDVKSFLFVRRAGSKVSMTCNAQGHPVPVTRYYLIERLSAVLDEDTRFDAKI